MIVNRNHLLPRPVTAVDILLEPNQAMIQHANDANARLR